MYEWVQLSHPTMGVVATLEGSNRRQLAESTEVVFTHDLDLPRRLGVDRLCPFQLVGLLFVRQWFGQALDRRSLGRPCRNGGADHEHGRAGCDFVRRQPAEPFDQCVRLTSTNGRKPAGEDDSLT